jgi:hypothetical protein
MLRVFEIFPVAALSVAATNHCPDAKRDGRDSETDQQPSGHRGIQFASA